MTPCNSPLTAYNKETQEVNTHYAPQSKSIALEYINRVFETGILQFAFGGGGGWGRVGEGVGEGLGRLGFLCFKSPVWKTPLAYTRITCTTCQKNYQETKDLKVEGSRSCQSSVTPLSGVP